MIDFSKIRGQINEEPIQVGADGVRRMVTPRQQQQQDDGVGSGGHKLESQVANNLLPQIYPDGNFKHVDSEIGTRAAAGIKTDVFQDAGTGDEQDNTNFSVKMKRANDKPVKVHQTGRGAGSAGLYSKLAVPYGDRPSMNDRGQFAGALRNNPLNQALVMLYGGPYGGLNKMRKLFNPQGSQRDFLRQFDSMHEDGDKERIANNPFLTSKELEDNFPKQYQALMDHLNDNKEGVFNNLVRMSGLRSNYYGDYGYADGSDASPVSRLITHKLNGGNRSLDGTTTIHDVGDDAVREAMENMEWRHDGGRLYLSDQELTSADGDRKLLDMYPINKENSKWAVLPQGDDAYRPGHPRAYENRAHGVMEPGHMKATMGTDDDFVDKYFPKIWEGEKSGDNWVGDFLL